MKVAIYVRVSTKDQNIDTQINNCENYCVYQKHKIFKIYKDIAESGKKHSRPAFDIMLSDMRKNKFKGIVVYKLDRIGRSLSHLITLFEEFKNREIAFTSTTQNIDTGTPEGRMFMHLMMVLAQYERELTVDRVMAGLLRAKKEGKILGRPKNKINKYEIMRLKNEGLSFRKIAVQLEISLGAVQRCLKK